MYDFKFQNEMRNKEEDQAHRHVMGILYIKLKSLKVLDRKNSKILISINHKKINLIYSDK